jgi:hypothetical protein
MFDSYNGPDSSDRVAELLYANTRLLERIELVGHSCLQSSWSEWHWVQFLAELAELVPPSGDGDYGDYELVRDYVCTQVDRRQFSTSLRKHGDVPEDVVDF